MAHGVQAAEQHPEQVLLVLFRRRPCRPGSARVRRLRPGPASEARWSTAAVTPARLANGSVPARTARAPSRGGHELVRVAAPQAAPGRRPRHPRAARTTYRRWWRRSRRQERAHRRHRAACVHPVDVTERPGRAGQAVIAGHIRPGPDDVAGRGDRHQPGALGDQHSPNCAAGSSPVAGVDIRPPHRGARPLGRLHPGPHVRVVVEPGHDHLVTRPPVAGQRPGQAVGQRGHVRAENHAVRLAAGQRGNGRAGTRP